MKRMLIIEDDKTINKLLCSIFGKDGYVCESAQNGFDGLTMALQNEYNIILMDLMLPLKTGEEVLREIRKSKSTPVIVLSAKGEVYNRIELLRLGADDYITKPFDLEEVVARVESNLRRSHTQAVTEKLLYYKDLVFDDNAKRITRQDIEVDLTAKECKIMELLLKNRGKVFTKANLYETIWEDAYLGDDNAVKTHISNLRSKLKLANPKEEYIETVWGLGYRLAKE